MTGLLIPPWFENPRADESDVLFATFLWGFVTSLAIFAGAKGFHQAYRVWTHSHRINAYAVMIWLVWVSAIVTAVSNWFYVRGKLTPRCANYS